jgi:hypothetical protein
MNLTSLLTTKPWAPLLAAWYLALALLTELGEAVDRRDGIGTLLYATITAIAAWFLSGWLTRDGARRSLCATLMVLWVGLFGTFRLTISARWAPFPMGEAGILLVWSLGFAVVVALVARSKSPMDNVLKALTVALALLIVIPAAGLLRRLGSPAPDASPVPGVWSMTRDPGTPDVYLILLDKYSHPHWLRQHYGLDVEPFLDSLRTLGFVIPARPRTNYIHTQLAVAALLNSRMVHEELAGLPGERHGPDRARECVQHFPHEGLPARLLSYRLPRDEARSAGRPDAGATRPTPKHLWPQLGAEHPDGFPAEGLVSHEILRHSNRVSLSHRIGGNDQVEDCGDRGAPGQCRSDLHLRALPR